MSNKFEFSIIIAIYNTEKYLNDAINSIINQTLNFKNNVQLILVDDGSEDNSKEICLNYQKKYPNNIIVLSKSNGGQSSARNLGLKYAQGKYINFLDSDDKLSLNALKDVKNFFSKNDNIDVVSLPIIFFDKKEGDHNLNYKFEKTRIINLKEEISYPQLHISSSFIRNHALKNREFNTKLVNGEDALLINQIILDKQKYGVINSSKYFYRKRFDESSTMDITFKSKGAFTEKIKNFYLTLIQYSISKNKSVPKFIQYIIAYDINGIIETEDITNIFKNNSEINEFWKYLLETLNYISEDVIDKHEYLDNNVKSFLIYLKNNNFHIVERPKKNKVFLKSNNYILNKLHNHKIRFDIIEYQNNKLNISGLFVSNCYNDKLKIKAILKNKYNEISEYIAERIEYPTTYRKTVKYLGYDWKFYYNFDLKIDINPEDEYEIQFKLIYMGTEEVIMNPKLKFRNYCNISEYRTYFINDKKIVRYKDNKLFVLNYSTKSMLLLELQTIFKILFSSEEKFTYSILINIIYLIMFPFMKNKRIWLFIDRPDVADDNAMHLFSYAVKQNDNIEKYFIIDKKSKDYIKMLKISKNIITFGSLKHKLFYIYSEKIISSHVNHDWLNPFYNYNQKLYSGLTKTQKCFLQHGVTKDDVSHWLRKFYHNLYLFLTLSEYEKNSIINGNYNYDESVVQLLGFPRYDNLNNTNSKREILFIPTWRDYLKSDKQFKNSSYFYRINNFLNNEKLNKYLKENNYKIIFKPHYNLLPYLDLFNIPKEIEISTEKSYQELFNNTSLMITDYSSVFFDYAYIKKPIIFYQNDDYHYEKGYFDYETMGFGKSINNENDLIEKIIEYIENDCKMEEIYKQRVDKFFKYTDKNNSKRVYEWLKNH